MPCGLGSTVRGHGLADRVRNDRLVIGVLTHLPAATLPTCLACAIRSIRISRSQTAAIRCENTAMNFQKILVPIGVVVGLALAYRFYSWAGVVAGLSLLVFWVLLNFTRMMQVLKRAAHRPIGYVDSAVMLNAKLKPAMTLLHVVAMTKSLGLQLSPKDQQPEVFSWTDNSASRVTCTFTGGKLSHHELFRPAVPAEAAESSAS